MPDRSIAPKIKDATDYRIILPAYEHFKLDNHIPVYLVPSEEQETLLLEFVFPAGSWYENKALVADATNTLLKNGTRRRTALQLNEEIEYFGAFLNLHCRYEHAHLTLHCLSKHIGDLLPLLQDILTEPAFPENELDIYRQNRKQRLAVNLQKCDFVANRHIDTYLFGAYHPYGRTSSMEDYNALQQEDLQGFFQKCYAGQPFRLFIAGNIPAGLQEQLNRYLGGDPRQPAEPLHKQDLPIQPAPEKQYRIDHDPNGVQGAIRVGRLFPNRYHPDFPKMKLLNTILRGYFGSRLLRNIREDKGYTYGIFSSLYDHSQSSALTVSTEAGREVCEAAVEEIFKELEQLRQQPIPEEELNLVRNYLMGTVLGDLDGPFQVLDRWKKLILADLDEQYFYNYIKTVKTATPGELQELAGQYFDPVEFYSLIVA